MCGGQKRTEEDDEYMRSIPKDRVSAFVDRKLEEGRKQVKHTTAQHFADVYKQAYEWIVEGHRIDAVKLLRQEFSLSTLEAKAIMEAMLECHLKSKDSCGCRDK